jgi:hypothetical protein
MVSFESWVLCVSADSSVMEGGSGLDKGCHASLHLNAAYLRMPAAACVPSNAILVLPF